MANPSLDPEDVNGRLYRYGSNLLRKLEKGETEEMTFAQQTAAFIAIVRNQWTLLQMRLKDSNDGQGTGATVKQFESAFLKPSTAHANRGRKGRSRLIDDDDSDDIDLDGFGDGPA